MKKRKIKFANSVLGGGLQNRKAFTLTELLAIIVILAIIAVITVPIILDVIDNARKGAIQDSAYGYKDAINKYYVTKLSEDYSFRLDGTYEINEDGTITDEEGTTHIIPFSGNIPIGGSLVYEDNILKSGNILFDGYTAEVVDGDIGTVSKGSGIGNTTPKLSIERVTTQVEGEITTGDEVKMGTEHFYVVSSDETETVLLAKYNLNVGNNTQDEAYGKLGMQNSLAIGKNSNNSTQDAEGNYPATIAFSSANYWYDTNNSSLKSTYGTSSDNSVYDADNYSGAPGSDTYSIAYYVEAYKKELEKLGVTIKDARILTYKEAENLGCELDYETCPTGDDKNGFISETAFWLSLAYQDSMVWRMDTNGEFGHIISFLNSSTSGVRPIIIVNTSDM